MEVQAPRRGSPDAAGVDLWGFAPVPPSPNTALCLDWHLTAGETVCFNTNLSVRIPKGYYGRVAPRSGLALQGVHVGAGVIDMDYTGAIGVVITNISSKVIHLNLRRPIAQLIITPYSAIDPVLMYDEDDRKTLRGETCFGSTDTSLSGVSELKDSAEALISIKEHDAANRMIDSRIFSKSEHVLNIHLNGTLSLTTRDNKRNALEHTGEITEMPSHWVLSEAKKARLEARMREQ